VKKWKVFYSKKTIKIFRMLEKEYKIRRATVDDETAEVTLPTAWKRYHKLKFGDKVKMLADGVIVILPPSATEEKEMEVRRFLEGDNK
jgi:bifunctional DNA-binding transcriptional regulator/antitoxin component of YhaV-PrlF toxin-antitoxin module